MNVISTGKIQWTERPGSIYISFVQSDGMISIKPFSLIGNHCHFWSVWLMGIHFQQPIGITCVQMWEGDWPQIDLSVWSVNSGQFGLIVLRHTEARIVTAQYETKMVDTFAIHGHFQRDIHTFTPVRVTQSWILCVIPLTIHYNIYSSRRTCTFTSFLIYVTVVHISND